MAITSTAGAGATVTLWFPEASIVEGQAEPADTEAPTDTRSRPAPVLVVDDDQTVLEMLGIELQELADGLAALAYLDRGETVDLLITDVSMPAMNGALLTQEARQRRAALPVMLLTGYVDANRALDLDVLQNDGVVLIRKPIVGQELAQRAVAGEAAE